LNSAIVAKPEDFPFVISKFSFSIEASALLGVGSANPWILPMKNEK
jgi:hypothetical protein